MTNAMTEPYPLPRPYFVARSCQALEGRPANATDSTSSRATRKSATFWAFSKWRSIRRLSVSMPWMMRKALNGEIAMPRSRSNCTRALRMNDPCPSAGQ